MNRVVFTSTVALCALVCGALSAEESFSGKVVGITDGDTISVMRYGKEVKVRLEGIDAPERQQAFYQTAKSFASDLVYGKVVTVKIKETDRYGRLVCRVSVNEQDLSEALIRAGFAWHYKQYSSDQVLAEAEISARKARRGLWTDANPTPPWQFRRGSTTSTEEPKKIPAFLPPKTANCRQRSECCRICSKGKACGNSCISASYTCRKGRGCACNSWELCS